MNRKGIFLAGLLVFCLLFQASALTSYAADGDQTAEEKKPYTYTLTFYAGNQGAFKETAHITVSSGSQTAGEITIKRREDGSAITVKGLSAGDQVIIDELQSQEENAPVEREENSLYYVSGIRKSGHDNSAVSQSAITVEQDEDYVIAYEIQGEMVPYVIHYRDADGNTLAPSRTYYGNVGDRPVVAFQYISGYEPQAYNLTKKLSQNTAENVFAFVYTRLESRSGEVIEEVIDGGTTIVEIPGGTVQIADGGANVEGADAGEAGELLELDDNETPLSDGPEKLMDLDDEETPLAYRLGNLDGATNMLGALVVGVSGAAALFALIIMVMKRRRKETAEK